MIIVDKNKVYEEIKGEFCNTWKEIEVPEQKPTIKWNKALLTLDLLKEVIGFFRWSYDKWKAETQVRLFFNTETQEWKAYPYKQQVSKGSMTTEDEHDEEARSLFPEPWVYLGTIHHHCSTSAFQSGTDKHDEQNQDGVHITIGKMDKIELDWHCRFSWAGELFDSDIIEWVEFPDWMQNVPERFHKKLIKEVISENDTYPFQEKWKEKVTEVMSPLGSNMLDHRYWDSWYNSDFQVKKEHKYWTGQMVVDRFIQELKNDNEVIRSKLDKDTTDHFLLFAKNLNPNLSRQFLENKLKGELNNAVQSYIQQMKKFMKKNNLEEAKLIKGFTDNSNFVCKNMMDVLYVIETEKLDEKEIIEMAGPSAKELLKTG